MLFCQKHESSLVEVEGNDNTSLTSNSSVVVNSVRDALKISQTFEYVPLASTTDTNCTSCLRRFPNGSNLNNVDVHILLSNSTKKVFSDQMEAFECMECHRDYLYKHPVFAKDDHESQSLTNEQQSAKKVIKKPFNCSICNRGFNKKEEMYQHELKHSKITNRYSCSKCNGKFPTRTLLDDHYESALNNCTPR